MSHWIADIHVPVTCSERVCSVLNISGFAPMSSSASRGTPSSLRARVSYSYAIILTLFAACVWEISPATRRHRAA